MSVSKWKTIDIKMFFYSHANYFHKKGFEIGLNLKMRVFGIHKSSVEYCTPSSPKELTKTYNKEI